MRVIDPADQPVFNDHPTGALAQRYLLHGDEGSAENFILLIAETVGPFAMPRHRHNFDQFRFPLAGDMGMGRDGVLREGWLGYFPEGASYGPQHDEAGPLALVLQFGGASGAGYLSPEQYRIGRAELAAAGEFDGPIYLRRRADGSVRKALATNAIWEHVQGRRLVLPAPRYERPVFVNPTAFRWAPVAGGARRRRLGTFSEREVSAEMYALAAGARLTVAEPTATRLWFALAGAGEVDGAPMRRHCAARQRPGEEFTLVAAEDTRLLCFRLPPVEPGWSDPESPGEAPPPPADHR